MKKIWLLLALLPAMNQLWAQAPDKGLTLEVYEKAKTFSIKDLDNDTYVKIENTYVLDRYEERKPYFITGDDGLKKRIDLYKLILKEGMQELGLMIFYTNEKGTQYKACMPGFKATPKVWEKYFEDIHAIDKKEANFVLKLSYVLSKEMGFQQYKALNQGKDISKEAGTYGSDICFPGTVAVTLANGSKKILSTIKAGDEIITVDPNTHQSQTVRVTELVAHEEKNYAITSLLLLYAKKQITAKGNEIMLLSKQLQATPNHPLMTIDGEKKTGDIKEGDQILCATEAGEMLSYFVWSKTEAAGGVQKVYNMVTNGGSTFIMNEVMVLQKPLAH